MSTTIVMVRHGETDWNRDSRFQGRADPPLNEVGRKQANELAERLVADSLSTVYSSPLRRAHETASIVAERLGLELRVNDNLVEVDVGSWSGLTRADVQARFPEGYQRWLDYDHGWEDGETYDELGRRVVDALRCIAEAHQSERVLTVTHGGPIRSALAYSTAVPFGEARRSLRVVDNCAIVRFAIREAILERVD